MSIICYSQVDSIEKATDVRVDITSNKFKMNNRTIICKIIREKDIIKMELEKILYIYDKEKNSFYKPKLEILKNKKVGEFLEISSIKNEEVEKLRSKFGENRMKIPIPSFFTLYKEQLINK